MYNELIDFIRTIYRTNGPIQLHEPIFQGNEKKYVMDTIDSTFVSSVGQYVDRFELDIATYTGCKRAVATVNGTAALHMALILAGVVAGDYVITQALSFVATGNAIKYCGADPIFIDVDEHTLGLSPKAMNEWLEENAELRGNGLCYHKQSNRVIRCCVPMHTFGHPVDLDNLIKISKKWNLPIVEDAAESFGSLYKGQHTGTFGLLGAVSFNGNKIITTGGGGMILTNQIIGEKAKYLTTTARKPHPYKYEHDAIGYNYRLPNINAALGCAQLEQLDKYIASKRAIAAQYENFFKDTELKFIKEPDGARSNYWLNAIRCKDIRQRDKLLGATNSVGIMTRPVWELLSSSIMYEHALKGNLTVSSELSETIINLPSSVVSGAS